MLQCLVLALSSPSLYVGGFFHQLFIASLHEAFAPRLLLLPSCDSLLYLLLLLYLVVNLRASPMSDLRSVGWVAFVFRPHCFHLTHNRCRLHPLPLQCLDDVDDFCGLHLASTIDVGFQN